MAADGSGAVYYSHRSANLFYYQAKAKWKGFGRHFKAGAWMVVYLLVMMTISCLGSDKFGGYNVIHYGWDMALIAVVALLFYMWALKSGFETEFLEDAKKLMMNCVLLRKKPPHLRNNGRAA